MEAKLEEISSLFCECRKQKGLTQEALGKSMGVGRACVSKIESGKGLTFSTIQKVAEALDAEVAVSLKPRVKSDYKVISYTMAAISEFADNHGLTLREAGNYLVRYKGIEFLENCYEAEHTLSFADCVEDLTEVCRNHGGGLR